MRRLGLATEVSKFCLHSLRQAGFQRMLAVVDAENQAGLRAVEKACRTTFMALGCRDVARVDLRLAPDGHVYVLEVNPLPGLTPDYSDLCLIANGAKIDYRTLIGEILSGAIKRWQQRQRVGDKLEEPAVPAAVEPTPPDVN